MGGRVSVFHKYQPLQDYLAAHPGERVALRLAEIESIIGRTLPKCAWMRGWWLNNGASQPQTRSWLNVGWRVAAAGSFRTAIPAVTFVRDDGGQR